MPNNPSDGDAGFCPYCDDCLSSVFCSHCSLIVCEACWKEHGDWREE